MKFLVDPQYAWLRAAVVSLATVVVAKKLRTPEGATAHRGVSILRQLLSNRH